MRLAGNEWYVGVDLGRNWTQVSCLHFGLPEPETKSTVAGSEACRIPTAICKRKSTGQWCLGEEAGRLAETGEGFYADDLWEKALGQEKVFLGKEYQAEDLLMVFLRKVLHIALPPAGAAAMTKCVFSIEEVTEDAVRLLGRMAEKLELAPDQVEIQDHKESFYAYAVCQEKELWQHDVLLFYCDGEEVWQQRLSCDRNMEPMVASVEERRIGALPRDVKAWDAAFAGMVREAESGRVVSSVYLIGSGFEGNWMRESLQAVCRGRRAFQGKNLYTKGACYSAMLSNHKDQAGTVYFCDYKVRENLMLKATKGDSTYFYLLAEAGINRHEAGKELRILLSGSASLDLWRQDPGSRGARVESLELPGLPSGEERCRLSLSLCQKEGGGLSLVIRDIGWGSLRAGTGLEWEYEL